MPPSHVTRSENKHNISATSKTVIENGHIDNSDDTETLIGSQFGGHKKKRGSKGHKNSDMVDINGMELPALGLPMNNQPDGE